MLGRIVLACSGLILCLNSEQAKAAEPRPAQATGRIEGRISQFPTAEYLTAVRVQAMDLYVGDSGRLFARAVVDADGSFVFEDVPAGRTRLNPVFDVGEEQKKATLLEALRPPTIVRASETRELVLFGKGRPLEGTLVLPASVSPENVRIGLEVPAPPTRGVAGQERSPDWDVYEALTATPLEAQLDSEGRFRIEGVREGNYRIWADRVDTGERLVFSGTADAGYPQIENGRLTVPFLTDGGSDKPFDLGSIRFDAGSSTVDR